MRPIFYLIYLSLSMIIGVSAHAVDKPIVGVSVEPLAYLVEAVAGSHVDVTVTVKAGQSPEVYNPSVAQLQEMKRAAVYLQIGLPFEDRYVPKLQQLFPQLSVVDLRAGVKLRKLEHHNHHGHAHTAGDGLDPHLWTSPQNMEVMGRTVRDALVKLIPEKKQQFEKGYEEFRLAMGELHGLAKKRLHPYFGKPFYVFHPSWGYFAEDYGLSQIAIEVEGKEPSPKDLARLVREAKAHKIKTIIVQQQFSTRAATAIASQVGAKVVKVDPLDRNYRRSFLELLDVLEGALAE